MRDEIDLIKQFTQDFPEVYVIESTGQKRDRIRRSSNTRRIPDKIVRIITKQKKRDFNFFFTFR